jgi:peptidoglycan hydrolase-like protein with peptidoglycan-binding domain/lysophospholipase L1-like esterase
MRFYEIKKLIEAEGQPGYYVIGDSHAAGIAKGAGKPWNNTAVGGRQADSGEVRAKVSQITPGSVVVVAAGANDTANSFKAANKDPKKVIAPNIIAGRVKSLVDLVKQQKPSKVILLVFPNGEARTDGMSQWYNGDYQEQVRSAIKSAVDVDQIIDQNDYKLSNDNIHLNWGEYVKIGKESVANNPIKGANLAATGTADTKSGDTTEAGLKSGPPYPPEQADAVKTLQKGLEAIGYSVGSTGIDGKYGPRTVRAVRAFKKDYKIEGDGISISSEGLAKLQAVIAGKEPKVEKPTDTGNTAGSRFMRRDDPDAQSPGYPAGMTQGSIESIIKREAAARNMDPVTAIKIFRAEGAGAYQSQIPRKGKGSHAGKEASFGPYQLYIGGGMGNQYEQATGRDLTTDNTPEGITNQIRFALDQATKVGWKPWYGRGPAGVGERDGLEGSKAIRNWS